MNPMKRKITISNDIKNLAIKILHVCLAAELTRNAKKVI